MNYLALAEAVLTVVGIVSLCTGFVYLITKYETVITWIMAVFFLGMITFVGYILSGDHAFHWLTLFKVIGFEVLFSGAFIGIMLLCLWQPIIMGAIMVTIVGLYCVSVFYFVYTSGH